MPDDLQKHRDYHTLMAGLNSKGPPTARFVHHASTPKTPALRIGVLDASFNPLTLAHEALLNRARQVLALPAMLLLLSKANVDKDIFGADLGQRLAMLVDYARGHPHLSIAGCSHARFVDKVFALRPHYPADATFYFIVGYDTLTRIFDPKYYADMQTELQPLFSAAHIVAANRGDRDAGDLTRFLTRPECAPFADRIHPIELPAVCAQISSTGVRARVRQGEPFADLVPPQIARAIEALRLYRP